MNELIKCTKCKQEKSLNAFCYSKKAVSRHHRQGWCKECIVRQNRERLEAKPYITSEPWATILRVEAEAKEKITEVQCSICKEIKPLDSFSADKRLKKRGGRQSQCKECKKRILRLYREKDPEKYREYRRMSWQRNPQRHLQRMVGISLLDKRNKFIEQGFKCAACGSTEHNNPSKKHQGESGWHADHDHHTGQFRGVLCWRCNITLGFAKESIERLHSLAAYLEHSNKHSEHKCFNLETINIIVPVEI